MPSIRFIWTLPCRIRAIQLPTQMSEGRTLVSLDTFRLVCIGLVFLSSPLEGELHALAVPCLRRVSSWHGLARHVMHFFRRPRSNIYQDLCYLYTNHHSTSHIIVAISFRDFRTFIIVSFVHLRWTKTKRFIIFILTTKSTQNVFFMRFISVSLFVTWFPSPSVMSFLKPASHTLPLYRHSFLQCSRIVKSSYRLRFVHE